MYRLMILLTGMASGFIISMLWWNCDLEEYLWFLMGVATAFICCYIGWRICREPVKEESENESSSLPKS